MVSRLGCTGVVALCMMVTAAGSSPGSPGAQAPSGTWVPAGSMAQARSGASAALLQDGTVLIAGGAKSGEHEITPRDFKHVFLLGCYSGFAGHPRGDAII